MLESYLFYYRFEALHTMTIDDAIMAMRHELQTGAFFFGMQH